MNTLQSLCEYMLESVGAGNVNEHIGGFSVSVLVWR